jgi:hypothetical protein
MARSIKKNPSRLFGEIMEAFKLNLLEQRNDALDKFEKDFWGKDHKIFEELQLDIEIERENANLDRLDLDDDIFKKQGPSETFTKSSLRNGNLRNSGKGKEEFLETGRPIGGYNLEKNFNGRLRELHNSLKKSIKDMFIVGGTFEKDEIQEDGTVKEGKRVGGQIDRKLLKKYKSFERKRERQQKLLLIEQRINREKLFSKFMKDEYPEHAKSALFPSMMGTGKVQKQRVAKRRLIVTEDYYHQIYQYFKLKKKQNSTKKGLVLTLGHSVETESDLALQIERNQILYSELLAQKLIGKKGQS